VLPRFFGRWALAPFALAWNLRMSAPASLIPELEEVLQQGSPERRAETLKRITAFFLDGASRFNDDHVRLFDQVFSRLIAEIETKARSELSHRLAPVGNAPAEVVRRLAHDDDIAVAGPVLKQSARIAETDLVDIARTKSQAHLLAISSRTGIAEPVTEVLVRRGDNEVARKVAENRGARLSDDSFSKLVGRAERDGLLAEKVGLRPDIPPRLFRDLLLKATEVVQQRLFASAKPETQAEIRRVLAKVSSEVGATAAPRDYSAAQRAIEALRREGKLDEAALVDFAKKGQYEEMIVALASLCAVPIEVVDRLMGGDRPDPVLILCKSAGWGWATVKALIMARPGGQGTSSQGLDAAYANFDRLSPTTAQRVMRFWQVRTTERE
jgi:uncharacterized protein (DUF2336 family)